MAGSATSPPTNDATSAPSSPASSHARLLAAGDEDEAGALAGERPRDRATDPFGRACDDRDLAAEATAHETTDSGQTAASPYFGAL